MISSTCSEGAVELGILCEERKVVESWSTWRRKEKVLGVMFGLWHNLLRAGYSGCLSFVYANWKCVLKDSANCETKSKAT